MEPREPIFEKCSHLRKKRGGADAFPGLVGCMGRISHTNLKIRMVISKSQLRKIS
jgi:hypothetical protein